VKNIGDPAWRVGNDKPTFASAIHTDSVVRIVGALLSHGEDSSLLASVIGNSELFRVPKGDYDQLGADDFETV
jgi:hypothetical protein